MSEKKVSNIEVRLSIYVLKKKAIPQDSKHFSTEILSFSLQLSRCIKKEVFLEAEVTMLLSDRLRIAYN